MPVQLSAPEFEVCILPHLSMPKRGLKCKLGYCRVFHLITSVLHGDGTNTMAKKGEKVIAITDNHGYISAPAPVAPVDETDMILLPQGLKALPQVAKQVGTDLRGAYLNLNLWGSDSPKLASLKPEVCKSLICRTKTP